MLLEFLCLLLANSRLFSFPAFLQLERTCNVAVSVRGRYMPQKEAISDEKPLFLYIQSRIPQCIEDAVRKIEQALQAGPTTFFERAEPPPQRIIEERITIGMDPIQGFDVKAKLQGPSNSFFGHISSQTGVQLSVRGKHSVRSLPYSPNRVDFEPIYRDLSRQA